MECNAFFDTFPELKLKDNLKDLFGMTQVEKITVSKSKSVLKIKLLSPRLIEKKQLNYVSYEIKKQLLNNTGLFVKIEPAFSLSSQYTPKNLYDAYKESIYEEILEESRMLANIFQSADISITGNDMVITLNDYDVVEYKVSQLVDIIKNIFERCGIAINIKTVFRENKKDIDKKFDIDEVFHTKSLPKPENKEENKEDNRKVKNTEGSTSESKGDGEEVSKKEEKKEFKRFDKDNKYFKREKTETREENPDVIYGRSFTDETIDIVNLSDESGEVAIRGQLMKVDIRAIRNEKSIVSLYITDFTDSIKASTAVSAVALSMPVFFEISFTISALVIFSL